MSTPADELLFAHEDSPSPDESAPPRAAWKLLIVDDEPGVHDVTQLALKDFCFDDRRLQFLHAYSAAEAKGVLAEHPDIALALVDVVMETDHAGLDLVQHIRAELDNQIIRLILRTGQPGQAPERTVIQQYDINDYKEKTELSAQKLFSTVYTGLRSYRDLMSLDANRRGLERVIGASTQIFKPQKLHDFIQGVMEQLVALLGLDDASAYVSCCTLAHCDQPVIEAATGRFAGHEGDDPCKVLPAEHIPLIRRAVETRRSVVEAGVHINYFSSGGNQDNLLYFTTPHALSEDDLGLLELFCHNVAIAYHNILLNKELEDTQREIVYMLGEAIESRSKETGSHVRRVAEYSRILGEACGLDTQAVDTLVMAAPLHDFGKISTPDAILHKPAKLDADEWAVMQNHAAFGEEMLGRSSRKVMQAAAVIAGQHHEHWDGQGYPRKLAGEDIDIMGRIVALADVYDALLSKRCYKGPWTIEQVHHYVREQAGKQFDPQLVDLLFDDLARFAEVAERYPD